MPKPLCFMIMPYGRKATQAEAGRGVPEIDFNALWDHAFAPTIIALGYEPVRADQDTGALIINQMIERLYFADLVLADMTIPNGNVYYEVGIRHAAKRVGCVLLAADWSKQLFDVAQMRTVRYPMPEGSIVEATAEAISAAIKGPIRNLARGVSPMHAAINGYPDKVDEEAASTMKEVMTAMAAFQGETRAVRALPRASRMAQAKELVAKYWKPPVTSPTARALLLLMKDSAENADDWNWITDFIGKLPEDIAEQEEVRELNALALSNAGKPMEAIAKLEALVAASGPTPERLGLLGGRYKRLAAKAATPGDMLINLNKSIDSYERGMELDLNEYYCSSNLPRLYLQRKRKGDLERAQSVSKIVIAACERAMKRGAADEWLRPTLLGAAFDSGDCDKAEELADLVAAEGAARWKLDSTLADLESSVAQVEDKDRKDRLAAILEDLRRISAG
ncbi:MAG TPA: tetratricopeptide repeat-containing protein [Roseiarcus sp.]|nr:tetratricopeptide repeat-containing protein [Roseiarcus sp.]